VALYQAVSGTEEEMNIYKQFSRDFFDLVFVDECHRATGNYAYVFIAEQYRETSRSPLILAMTASPGGRDEKVQEVCRTSVSRLLRAGPK
jgi:ERCC4-related helicase